MNVFSTLVQEKIDGKLEKERRWKWIWTWEKW